MIPTCPSSSRLRAARVLAGVLALSISAQAQLIDRTMAPNAANEGIAKSYTDQIGAGRGNITTLNSSAFIIARDPFRSIRRGRQIFQRKFTEPQGAGPLTRNGQGDVGSIIAIGAGLSDSCAACHGRPRGSAGVGGDVATRPDSRDSPHLFGAGLKEMLADEFTTQLRKLRDDAIEQCRRTALGLPDSIPSAEPPVLPGPPEDPGVPPDQRPPVDPGRRRITVTLTCQGINFGSMVVDRNGVVDDSKVVGVDRDLRVRPFFAHGEKFTVRESLIGAFNDEMGLQSVDPELAAAKANRTRMVSPAGMVFDGATDRLENVPASSPTVDPDGDGVVNEIPTSIVDHVEFYLLNYFKPGTYEETPATIRGRQVFTQMQCVRCHVPDLTIQQDRRVADLETKFDSERGIFNGLFATATPKFNETNDRSGHPTLKAAKRGTFVVKNIFTDLKRHDLGTKFHERNYNGTTETLFLTAPLWGIGTSSPYGHDGRSINLAEVILRHGGEAATEADRFASLSDIDRACVLEFLQSLVLFPPDDTASTLDPGNRAAAGFPQVGHGAIKLGVLFNNPADPE